MSSHSGAPTKPPATIKVGNRTFRVLFPDLFRTLTADEYSALSDSIRIHGLQYKVVVDEEDGIVDGINRLTILSRIDDFPPQILNGMLDVVSGKTLDQKRELAFTLNDARRHMKPQERKAAAERMEKLKKQAVELRASGATLKAAAEKTGLSLKTVHRATADSTLSGDKVDQPDKAVGQDGKSRPTTYKPRKPKAEPATLSVKPAEPEDEDDDELDDDPFTEQLTEAQDIAVGALCHATWLLQVAVRGKVEGLDLSNKDDKSILSMLRYDLAMLVGGLVKRLEGQHLPPHLRKTLDNSTMPLDIARQHLDADRRVWVAAKILHDQEAAVIDGGEVEPTADEIKATLERRRKRLAKRSE